MLDLTIFLNSQEATESNTKSSQNSYMKIMYNFMNFLNLMKKTEKKNKKKHRIISKKLICSQTYMEFNACYKNVKNDGHTIDVSKFPQRMKKKLLTVSAR